MSQGHGEGQTLVLEDVACLRGDRLLFDRLNLALGAGDAALVTGPNGAGKSSLLRLIAGLLTPAAGRVDVTGGIALAAEQAALDEGRTLGAALTFWARIDLCLSAAAGGTPRAQPDGGGGRESPGHRALPLRRFRRHLPLAGEEFAPLSDHRLAAAMAAMDIARLGDIPVRMLSTGQRKRAVLARTIASGAGVWLLDEPGNGLDDLGLAALGAAIAAHRAGGGIIVAASHQPLPFAPTARIAL